MRKNQTNFIKNRSIVTCLISAALAIASPAVAETQIDISYNTPSFKDKELVSEPVKIIVTYDKPEDYDAKLNNLQYQILYNNTPRLTSSTFTIIAGSVTLKDLDGNKTPEVIISTFSGGAHCCTNFTFYTWLNNRFVKTETGFLDGGGGRLEDLDGDAKLEFISSDNSFYYAFDSYAGSFPPSQIYAFNNGKLEDVTRKHVKYLRSQAWEMYQAFLQSKKQGGSGNGILAGYAAQKALLGEFKQGWEFVLANYDRTSDWGLTIYQGDREVGKYPDFPTALKTFLTQQGYLNRNMGLPLPTDNSID